MTDTGEVPMPSGDGGPDQKRLDAPMDRVLRALSHPVRRRILRALVDGPGSASTLSKKLQLSLGTISYHLNQVLARECEVIELTDSIARRGAIEKFYRLKFQALTEGDSAQEGDDPEGPRVMSFEECFIVAVAAMDANAFETLQGSAWEWFLAQVDSMGWSEICVASDDFKRRVWAAVESSKARSGEKEHEIVAGVAALPAVSSSPPVS